MNPQHFQAFLWLRWRLLVNQVRRSGIVNVVVLLTLAVCGVVTVVGAAIVSFLLGLLLLADVSPAILLYVWDGLVSFLPGLQRAYATLTEA